MMTSKLPSLIGMRLILKGWFNKIRVQPWITVLVPCRFPSAISMSYSVIGRILIYRKQEIWIPKLFIDPESNNTQGMKSLLTLDEVGSSGWPVVSTVTGLHDLPCCKVDILTITKVPVS
ncbi:hypothetical protein Tco_0459664 [Tanacetum coccineum]